MNTNRSEAGVADITQPARPGPSWGEPSLDGSIEQSIGRTLARVQELTLAEVEAMALFAMASGIGIGAEIAEILQVCAGRSSGGQARDPPVVVFSGEVRPGEMAIGDDADEVAFTLTGRQSQDRLAQLSLAHRALCRLIAPARPGTVMLIREDRRKYPRRSVFGAVPIVRAMLALAVLSLVTMLSVALSGEVNVENMTKGLLSLEGPALLANEVFLLSASLVGATLANLKRLDRYVSACNYDSRHDGSYWTRLVMGLISGVLLSQVIYGALGGQASASEGNHLVRALDQPVLALLGGFSAQLVHDILAHFIDAIGHLFGTRSRPEGAPVQSPSVRSQP